MGACLLAGAAACSTGFNYSDPGGPRYGAPVPAPARTDGSGLGDTLHIVTFNIKEGTRVETALDVLTEEPTLRSPDVLLLQEMDEEGTRRIAEELGLGWVYYPASHHEGRAMDVGNAVLSRWPIVDDEKLVLPHESIFSGTRRIAVGATLRVGRVEVRVYSVHLATPPNQAWADRREQMVAVLDDADHHPRAVLGGDFNSGGMGRVAARRGFLLPTREGPRTHLFGRFDHIYLRGLLPVAEDGTGTILDTRGASDHRPVWVRAVIR